MTARRSTARRSTACDSTACDSTACDSTGVLVVGAGPAGLLLACELRWQAGVKERSNMAALADELKRGGPVPDVPSIVLSPEGTDPGLRLFMSGKSIRETAEGGRRRNQALAASVSQGECRSLPDARHSTVTTDRADAVVQAIAYLLDMTRR